ncbi:hypothetical protein LTR50_006283 [Elasticomyces elasticus]|nr:hypothetical protein LTR50_006283 [Elasticomyces elasticus]
MDTGLSHIEYGPHDAKFHALWDTLRDEHETLLRKGYTGEGFLSKGHKLGSGRVPPSHEMRRLARASAEKRRALGQGSGQRLGGAPARPGTDMRRIIADTVVRRNTVDKGCASGTKGAQSLADEASRNGFRTKAEEDDANDRAIAQALYDLIEEEEERKMNGTYQAPSTGGLGWSAEKGLYPSPDSNTEELPPHHREVRTILDEGERLKGAFQESIKSSQRRPATSNSRPVVPPPKPQPGPNSSATTPNGRPISRLVQDAEKKAKRPPPSRRPVQQFQPVIDLTKEDSNVLPLDSFSAPVSATETVQAPPQPVPDDTWACDVCTCLNPLTYLACDACGIERTVIQQTQPQPRRRDNGIGWSCPRCSSFMEHKWWSCSNCGMVKTSS